MRQFLSRNAFARVLFLISLVLAVGCDSGNNNPMSGGGGAGASGDGGAEGTDPTAAAAECERAVIQELVVFKYDGIDVVLVGQETGSALGGFMYLPFGGEHIRVDMQFERQEPSARKGAGYGSST